MKYGNTFVELTNQIEKYEDEIYVYEQLVKHAKSQIEMYEENIDQLKNHTLPRCRQLLKDKLKELTGD